MPASLIRIALGLIAACLSAGLIHELVVAQDFGRALTLTGIVDHALANAVWALPIGAILVALGEWQRLRNVFIYLLGGIVVAVLADLFNSNFTAATLAEAATRPSWLILMAMGAFAGLTYWLIRGYQAGWAGDRAEAAFADTRRNTLASLSRTPRARCWPCLLAGLALAALPFLALGLWGIAKPDLAASITARTEIEARQSLVAAGYPWATVKIVGHRGHIEGVAPTDAARAAAFTKAEAILAPAIGIPGVIALLANDLTLPAAPAVALPTVAPAPIARLPAVPPAAPAGGVAPIPAPPSVDAAAIARAEADARARAAAAAAETERLRLAGLAADAKTKTDADARAAAETAKADADRIRAAALTKEKADAEAVAKAQAVADRARTAAEADARARVDAERLRSAAEAANPAKNGVTPGTTVVEKSPAAAAAPVSACTPATMQTVADLRITFDTASSDLGDPDLVAIDRAFAAVQACSDLKIQIVGHTDSVGNSAYNDGLASRRADIVRTQLENRGIPAKQLFVRSYGASRPIAANATDAGRASNRRVEFIVLGSADVAAPANAAAIATCRTDLAQRLGQGGIEFEPNKAVITGESAAQLDRLASAAQSCASFGLLVEGHADKTGNAIWNQELSALRAKAVRTALVERGIAPGRVKARGFGSSRLLDTGDTSDAHARNRRIEISVGIAK